MQNIRAAAVQMISSTDPDANTAAMKRLVRQAAEQGADWVLLPEYWPLMGRNDTDKLAFAEPLVSGRLGETRYARFQTALSETAAELPPASATICVFPNFSAPSGRLTFCCCPPPSLTPRVRRIGNCCCAPARWKTNVTS